MGIKNETVSYLYPLLLIVGLGGIVISILANNLLASCVIITLPLLFIFIMTILKKPITLFYTLFIVNYYVMGVMRYIKIDGISLFMDILLISNILLIIIYNIILNNIEWKRAFNILTLCSFIWMVYTILEVINPTGVFQAWILSRGLVINAFLITIITALLFTKYENIKILTFLFSVLTITAILKVLMQKNIGFDSAEMQWFNEGSNRSTHLLSTGTRYFSFFTDAGNFGSNMGCACILFGLTALSTKKIMYKVYYIIVSLLSLYAMFLSGTRGAMIVPLGGIMLFTVISKNVKALTIGSLSLIFIYVFFAFTMIGQGNSQIRRMRTAFNPTEDGSYNVRKENQKKLGIYLKNKPFGEGIGLSGVENQKISMRFTTLIPHDSWYVKIWVETGIVGLTLYLAMIFITIGRGAWILMFKIKNIELKGILSGYLCGIFGLSLSAYGNAFWGQYPTYIFVFTGMTLVLCGKYFDNEIENKNMKQIEF